MTLNFENNGVRYSLVVSSPGRAHSEPDIKPDPTLWASEKQKHISTALSVDSPEYASRQRRQQQKRWKRHYSLVTRSR